MKKIINYTPIVFVLLAFISCNNSKTPVTEKKETPKALQENSLSSYKEIRGNEDLVEDLYKELSNQTPTLKTIDKEIDDVSQEPDKLEKDFDKYKEKSENYYTSANNKARDISDSLLKKKIISIIERSNYLYTNGLTESNALLKLISKNEITVNDHYKILKVLLTLPIIEKYQKDNLPDKKKLKDLIKQQGKLIERIDSLIPIKL